MTRCSTYFVFLLVLFHFAMKTNGALNTRVNTQRHEMDMKYSDAKESCEALGYNTFFSTTCINEMLNMCKSVGCIILSQMSNNLRDKGFTLDDFFYIVNRFIIQKHWNSNAILHVLSWTIQRSIPKKVELIDLILDYESFEWWSQFFEYEFERHFHTYMNLSLIVPYPGYKNYMQIYYDWYKKKGKDYGICHFDSWSPLIIYMSNRNHVTEDLYQVFDYVCQYTSKWHHQWYPNMLPSVLMLDAARNAPLNSFKLFLKYGDKMVETLYDENVKYYGWSITDMINESLRCGDNDECYKIITNVIIGFSQSKMKMNDFRNVMKECQEKNLDMLSLLRVLETFNYIPYLLNVGKYNEMKDLLMAGYMMCTCTKFKNGQNTEKGLKGILEYGIRKKLTHYETAKFILNTVETDFPLEQLSDFLSCSEQFTNSNEAYVVMTYCAKRNVPNIWRMLKERKIDNLYQIINLVVQNNAEKAFTAYFDPDIIKYIPSDIFSFIITYGRINNLKISEYQIIYYNCSAGTNGSISAQRHFWCYYKLKEAIDSRMPTNKLLNILELSIDIHKYMDAKYQNA